MTLGPENVKASGIEDFLLFLGALSFVAFQKLRIGGFRVLIQSSLFACEHFGITAEQDIGSAPGHVGGNGNGTATSGLGDNLRFALMMLGIEDIVRDAPLFKHLGQRFGLFDGDRAHQNGLPRLMTLNDILNGRFEFFHLTFIDDIGLVITNQRPVGRDDHDFELVYLMEFRGFRIGGTRHARQLLVHAEIVLEGNGGQRLVFALDLDAFLGLDRLVQAVAPAPTRHDATGKFVDNHHLAVLDDVVDVLLEQRMGFESLIEVMEQLYILWIIEIFNIEQALALGNAFFRQGRGACFFVHGIIAGVVLDRLADLAIARFDDFPFFKHGNDTIGRGIQIA